MRPHRFYVFEHIDATNFEPTCLLTYSDDSSVPLIDRGFEKRLTVFIVAISKVSFSELEMSICGL